MLRHAELRLRFVVLPALVLRRPELLRRSDLLRSALVLLPAVVLRSAFVLLPAELLQLVLRLLLVVRPVRRPEEALRRPVLLQ